MAQARWGPAPRSAWHRRAGCQHPVLHGTGALGASTQFCMAQAWAGVLAAKQRQRTTRLAHGQVGCSGSSSVKHLHSQPSTGRACSRVMLSQDSHSLPAQALKHTALPHTCMRSPAQADGPGACWGGAHVLTQLRGTGAGAVLCPLPATHSHTHPTLMLSLP